MTHCHTNRCYTRRAVKACGGDFAPFLHPDKSIVSDDTSLKRERPSKTILDEK